MAKKQTAKQAPKTTKKINKKVQDEQIVLSPAQDKAFLLVDKSAKVRAELEAAVVVAVTNAVRKVMKNHDISLSALESADLAAIWFGA